MSCPKTTSMTDFIIEHKLDILAITESWLNGDGHDDPVLADIKYTLPRFDIHHMFKSKMWCISPCSWWFECQAKWHPPIFFI